MDTEDRWYVDVGGSPKMMTLDELVEAYEAGQITAQSLVTEVGGTEWRTLAEVADLGEDEEAEAPASVQAAVHAPSYAPQAAPQASYPPRAVAASGSAWPPVAVANASRPSLPAASVSHSTLPPHSMAPVVQDLSIGLDDDMPFKKSGKSKFALIGVAAALGLGVAGFGLTRGGETTTAPVAAAAVPVPFNTPTLTTPSTPTPSTPAASPTPAEPTDSDKSAEDAKSGRLSEDMKAALLAQDKERSVKKKGGAAKSGGTRARTRSPRSSSNSDSVFRAGGSADDPLNSKL